MKFPVLIATILLLVASFAAQAAEPVQTKPGRSHAILGKWHGSSYSGGGLPSIMEPARYFESASGVMR
jgi:hypothetical protein